jgi:cytochrome P450
MSEHNPTTSVERPAFVLPFAAADLPDDALFTLTEGLRASNDVLDVTIGEGAEATRCVILGHPDDLQTVHKDRRFSKGRAYDTVRRVFDGDGVLTSDGDRWTSSNRIARPVLRRQQVAAMVGTMATTGSRCVERLRERIQTEPVVDLKEELTGFTFQTITDVLFGEHAETVRSELSYADLQATFEAIAQARSGLSEEEEARISGITARLNALMRRIITPAREAEPTGTMLSVFAHATDRAGNQLDDATVSQELITFLFAGYETVALTLTWMFHTLQDHPEIAERMQQEIDTVLQGRPPDAETFQQLVFTRQVIDEVLRFRPPAPIIAREATKEVKFKERTGTDGQPFSITVHPGDIVLGFIWGAHHHPDFWTDPERFNPARFLVPADQERIEQAYMPFAGGPRSCTGQFMATAEAVVHTALLMQAFNLQIVPEKAPVFPTAGITLQPSRPIRAHIEPRDSH